MDENAKRAFDALHALAEQAWRDWDHKSRHEWRLSFAIWAALLAAAAARLQTSIEIPVWVVVLAGAFVFLFHALFLRWIQKTLDAFRNDYHAFRSRMPAPATPAAAVVPRPPWYKSPSVHTQLAVTLLLVVALVVVSSRPTVPIKQAAAGSDQRGLTTAAADGPRAACPK
jgi:hypothetical protein